MIPVQTLETFDIFGDPSSQVSPAPAKYAQGYLPGEVLPAQHENFFLGKSSRCVTQLRDGVASIENELVNVVTAGGATPDASTNNQVLSAINYLIAAAEARAKLAAHPVGSLFWTSEPPTIMVEGVTQNNPAGHPQLLFGGGTWVRLKGAFIWAAGDNDTVSQSTFTPGINDGRTSVTLAEGNLPKHTHGLNSHTHGVGTLATSSVNLSHSHGLTLSSLSGSNHQYDGNWAGTTTNWGNFTRYTDSQLGDHSHTISGSTGTPSNNSTTDGGFANSSFSIKNPYINRYCWERTA